MSRYTALIVTIAVISCIIFIPLKIIGYGYLPGDDALRHSAKVISGKNWNEILVMRPEARIDNHVGWHAILGFVHRATGCDAEGLVVFSVVSLFILFCLVPVFFLRRTESWLCALLLIFLADPLMIIRLTLGRPYIITMSFLLALCFLWPRLKSKRLPLGTMALFTALAALTTWIHGSWYLLIIPIASFFLAREFRAGILFTASVILGVLCGAIMTGHPYLFLKQNVLHMFFALGGNTLTRMLVSEFQPFVGDALIVFTVILMLIWRRLRGAWNIKAIDNPVFILAAIGWVLGFKVLRFWIDWGMPALAVWLACELQDYFKKSLKPSSGLRVVIAVTAALVFYLAVTADVGGRWTRKLTTEYLTAEDKEQAAWLPGPGGIIYSDEMSVFYDTFYKNPHAPWRYMVGFETALMPPEDLAIFRNIQWNFGAYKSFEPWVKKMRPQDRLILKRPSGEAPKIQGLEWYYAATDTWIGRLPGHSR